MSGFAAVAAATFVYFSFLVYGTSMEPTYTARRKWLSSWDFV
jgi:dolichyl-phosphate-mannose--protein O-mannosyl transferase